jgi:hypothetical protein
VGFKRFVPDRRNAGRALEAHGNIRREASEERMDNSASSLAHSQYANCKQGVWYGVAFAPMSVKTIRRQLI